MLFTLELCHLAKRPDESGRGRHECPRHEIQDERSTRGGDDSPHMTNFIEAVRSRNYKSLNAEIEIGAMSAALGNLANIAFRLGRELKFDPAKRQFINDREADKMLTRDYRKGYVVPDKV